MPQYRGRVELDTPSKMRCDIYIAEHLALMSRSQLKARALKINVNGKDAKYSFPVKNGDELSLSWEDEIAADILPENIPLDVLYEDENIIVIDKAQGMVVHPGAGNWSGTLVNALLWKLSAADASFAGNSRPFIVHRLDKDTSGVIICAKNLPALTFLQNEFKSRRVQKTYIALARGKPPAMRGVISTYLARDKFNRKSFAVSCEKGKIARTRYKVLKSFYFRAKFYTLFLVKPETGRTHQIRVHLKHIGCPIVGDAVYCPPDKNFKNCSLMLHARRLALRLPGEGGKALFKAPVPARFFAALKRLEQR